MSEEKPVVVQKKAIDLTPHFHALWCTVGGSEPMPVEIVLRSWSDSGELIQFMLDTHNFFSAEPDELVRVVEMQPSFGDDAYWKDLLARDARVMSDRPPRMRECPHCNGTGQISRSCSVAPSMEADIIKGSSVSIPQEKTE